MEDPTRRRKDARWRSARGDDVDLDGGHDVGVQAHGSAVAAGRLDRRHDLDLAAVDGRAAGGLDRVRQGRGGHGAKEAAVVTGGGGDGDDVGWRLCLLLVEACADAYVAGLLPEFSNASVY